MGTPRRGSAFRRLVGPALGVLIGCACSGPGNAATHSPSQIASSSRSASPMPSGSVPGAYGAPPRVDVEDRNGGGNHVNSFSETGAYSIWPRGWHGTNNLVVAKVPACMKGSGSFGPLELHVVDPATATRRFTIGSPTCVVAGPPSPAGAVCETVGYANVLNWIGGTVRSFPINGLTPALLSPDGMVTAIVGPS